MMRGERSGVSEARVYEAVADMLGLLVGDIEGEMGVSGAF